MDELFDQKGDLWRAVNCTLKGKEAKLPLGREFCDNHGSQRSEMRIKWWWLGKCPSWPEAAFENLDEAWAGESFDVGVLDTPWLYPPDAKSVFCGHYGLSGEPRLLAGNVCCVDYSFAKAGRDRQLHVMSRGIRGNAESGERLRFCQVAVPAGSQTLTSRFPSCSDHLLRCLAVFRRQAGANLPALGCPRNAGGSVLAGQLQKVGAAEVGQYGIMSRDRDSFEPTQRARNPPSR